MTFEDLTPVEQQQECYSEMHKSLYGFRPRHATAEQWASLEWLDAQIAELVKVAPAIQAADAAREQARITRFEGAVTRTMAAGKCDRTTAIRWIMDAEDEDCRRDPEYFEYTMGLPYGYLKSHP
jgi:hypothetical protein